MSTPSTPGKDGARQKPQPPTLPRSVDEGSSQDLASRNRSPPKFFLLVFALSVPFWLVGAVTSVQLLPGLPVSALALVCPAIAASMLVYRENGSASAIALLKRSFDYRRITAKVWYVPIVLLSPGVTVLAYGLMRWMELPVPAPQFPVLAALGLFLAAFVGALGVVWGPRTLARFRDARWGRAAAALAVIAAVITPARAQEVSARQARKNVWFALPVVFYLPETSLAFGATGALHLVRSDRKTSSVQPSVVYTLERQSYAEIMFQLFDSDRTAIAGAVRAAYFPYEFYGIGALAPEEAGERFTTRYAEILIAREWQVSKGLRLGPKLHARAEELVEVEASGLLASSAAPSADYRAAGLGATFTFDDRDDLFWPTRGTLVEVWALAYAADAARTFARGSLAARRFVPLAGGHTLGIDARVEAAGGDVPFTLLPKIGGARGLRGYYEGRWRDRFLWSTQAEWRFPIAWRLRGTLFAGMAGVAPSLARIDETRPRPAGGIGLRMRVTSTGLNVRGDVAVGEDGPFTYLTIGEAF